MRLPNWSESASAYAHATVWQHYGGLVGPVARFAPIGWKKLGTGRTAYLKPDAVERAQPEEIARLRHQNRLTLEPVVQAMRRTPRPNGHYWSSNSVARAERAFGAGFPKFTVEATKNATTRA